MLVHGKVIVCTYDRPRGVLGAQVLGRCLDEAQNVHTILDRMTWNFQVP